MNTPTAQARLKEIESIHSHCELCKSGVFCEMYQLLKSEKKGILLGLESNKESENKRAYQVGELIRKAKSEAREELLDDNSLKLVLSRIRLYGVYQERDEIIIGSVFRELKKVQDG